MLLVAFLKMVPFAILPVLRQNFLGRTPPKLLGIKFLKGGGVKDIHSSCATLTGFLVRRFLAGTPVHVSGLGSGS